MRGESKKWVWLWAVETTPERSLSSFCRSRAAERATRPPASVDRCIVSISSRKSSLGSVKSSRTWSSVRRSVGRPYPSVSFAAT